MKPILYKEYLQDKKGTSSVTTKIYSTGWWRFFWHYHPDEFEIFFPTVSIHTECIIGDYRGEVENGNIYFIPPGLPHSFHNMKKPARMVGSNLTFRAVRFNMSFLEKLGAFGSETKKIQTFLLNLFQGRLFYGEDAKKIQDIIIRLVEKDNDGSVESFYNFLEIIKIMYYSKEYKTLSIRSASQFTQHNQSNKSNQISDYLRKNFREKLTLEQISKEVNMSVTNMCRVFKTVTKKTIICYLNELRIANAATLLIETDETILDIAFDSGFLNLSYFNRKFKKIKGTQPSQYRKIQITEELLTKKEFKEFVSRISHLD